jgi:hypothetical protein
MRGGLGPIWAVSAIGWMDIYFSSSVHFNSRIKFESGGLNAGPIM